MHNIIFRSFPIYREALFILGKNKEGILDSTRPDEPRSDGDTVQTLFWVSSINCPASGIN